MTDRNAAPTGAAAPDAQFQALVRERYAGRPDQMTALGVRLLVGRDAPHSPVDGEALLVTAANEGDAEAWFQLAVLSAAGVARPQSWTTAYAALARAALAGHPAAEVQRALLAEAGLGEASAVESWLAAARPRPLRDAPRMSACAGLVPAPWCTYLCARAAPKLERARVYDYARGVLKEDRMRTNTGAPFSLIDTDLVIQLVRARLARAAGVALEHLEPFEILHYSPGEQYTTHIDFFHPDLPNYRELLAEKGQRIKTCLVYLNDDYEGGATRFPTLDFSFRGERGEAFFFDNVRPDGRGDMETRHAGLPPTRGEKWLLSQWVRDRPQRVA